MMKSLILWVGYVMVEKIAVNDIKHIVKEAGQLVLDIYSKDFDIEFKDDKSPLTQADRVANELICTRLRELYPMIPIMSEENKQTCFEERSNWEHYWCIDPIDGTKEFIKKNDEFTINIALIQENRPVLGVVYAPALDIMYSAKKNEGAFKDQIKLPVSRDDEKYIIVASKSHMSQETQEYINSIKTTKEKELVSMGSSLKLCLVAEGQADCYPRIAPTMEWDTAAAHAIVLEAGKKVYQFSNQKELVYNKENLLNPYFIVR